MPPQLVQEAGEEGEAALPSVKWKKWNLDWANDIMANFTAVKFDSGVQKIIAQEVRNATTPKRSWGE